MSDDLVKRLESGYVSSGLMREAAARIEALEEANGTMAMMAHEDGKRITALEAENKRLREARESAIAYSIDLQRIIEDLCTGKEIREPETTARFHYDMAKRYFARRAAAALEKK